MFRKIIFTSSFTTRKLSALSRFLTLSEYPQVRVTCLNPVRKMSSALTTQFEDAKAKLKKLQDDPGDGMKLKLYGLFKQATIGPCNQEKPGVFDFVAKAKWEAWNSLGSLTQDDAKKQYISIVDELLNSDSSEMPSVAPGEKTYEGITFKVDNNITRITFNRPQKKNAITINMYTEFISALKEADENDTTIAVITGEGDYYSSGNDLTNFTKVEGDIPTLARNNANMLKSFVAAFIDFRKPIIAAVNGPAVGIPVTLLGLFDAVYASDKATFYTPFSLLGQSPEACSTYTFPKIMGYAKANEVLLFNKKLTAEEAKAVGLVSEVFPHAHFHESVEKQLSNITSGAKQSMIYSKQLIRDLDRDTLHRINAAECDRLTERWQSPDCMQAIMNFLQRKSKM